MTSVGNALAACGDVVPALQKVLLLPSSDPALRGLSCCQVCNHSAYTARQGDGADEQVPFDTHGARKLGQGDIITPLSARRCDSAANGKSCL